MLSVLKPKHVVGSLCNKFYTYPYHHIVVLDKYIHSNLVYYKHNGDDEPYDIVGQFRDKINCV